MSIEVQLKNEKIFHLDLHEFSTVESGTPVRDAVDTLRRERHNCGLILKDQTLIGIFTDRDVLQKVVMNPDTWDQPIDDIMTANPVTVNPQDSADTVLNLMDEGRFRNVPVVNEDGTIRGNVTHYAFIKFLADHFPQEVYNLSPDDGIHNNRYGG